MENVQVFIDTPREGSAIPLKDRYLELDFDVNRRAGGHAWIADGDHIRLVNLDPTAPFIKYRLTSASGKELEEIDSTQIICSMYKLISSSRDGDNFSIGVHRSTEARERELSKNETTKGSYHVRIILKEVFGFQNIKKMLHMDWGIQ